MADNPAPPGRPEKVALVTGSLAEPRLTKIAGEITDATLHPVVVNVGVKVAALMTAEIVERRLKLPEGTDRVLMPGRFRGDLDRLERFFGVPFTRGPDEMADLPDYFGQKRRAADLSQHDVTIFAEIVDATVLDIDALIARALFLKGEGADVIDLGCLPDTPFPHLEEAIAALHEQGLKVSVDSFDLTELTRATRAGADYLLSLNETTLDVAKEGPAIPILVPATQGDLSSLCRAVDACLASGQRFYADPILDPIHYGYTASVVRYAELRRRYPDIPILMGIGNVTELTDADTTGINAILMGMISELRIQAVLAVQVSPHCRTAVREFDRARREYFAARQAGALPQGFGGGLMALRDRKPYAASPEEIARLAGEVRDRNFRIDVTEAGIHIYNRDGHHVASEPFALFPHLGVEADGAHAFYLGVETARAEIASKLGKRYAQDEGLKWGAAGEIAGSPEAAHRLTFKEAGTTLQAKASSKAAPKAGETPVIREAIVTTRSLNGEPHIAPMGATVIEGGYLLMPFRPSRTLDNLASTRIAVVNFTDDVRIFASCVVGRRLNVDVKKATYIDCPRLADALSHDEVTVERAEDDPQRPKFFCKTYHSEGHTRFDGMNRAKAAVLEAAVLVSRLNMLPDEKVDQEMAYLAIAVEKTAGPDELEAWSWMLEAVANTAAGVLVSPAAPGLLASVTDLHEMELARAGGADIVDLKQPAFGALGAWSTQALTAAVMLWSAWGEQLGAAGRPALSATVGDQPMVPGLIRAAAERVSDTGVPLVKVGLFVSPHANECIEALAPLASRVRLIGVLFADEAPDFAVLAALGRAGFAGVMVDTADKKAGPLTAHLDPLTLGQFVAEARRHGLMTGLAGSLRLEDIPALVGVGADYLGFRGALCEGGRTGTLDPARLGQVHARLREPSDH